METVLKIENLSKSFGNRKILHDISFETYKGEVFGFLGPNGAGKTTTIKIAVGLLSLDEGKITINGSNLSKNFEQAMQDIGAIVENPEMYKKLTGMQNLRQYARLRSTKKNPITQDRIDEVVNIVKLANRINDKVKKYSLGMKQRLGVAQALLHRPAILILDEPTNGLDPAGIKELRDILKDAAHKENLSIIVSSHLMSEMELMCDRVGIIVKGKLVDVQPIESLVRSTMDNRTIYRFGINDPQKAASILSDIPDEYKKITDDKTLEISFDTENVAENASLAAAEILNGGLVLFSMTPLESKRLEDVFIELTESGGEQIA